jgi:hypothetical protein
MKNIITKFMNLISLDKCANYNTKRDDYFWFFTGDGGAI